MSAPEQAGLMGTEQGARAFVDKHRPITVRMSCRANLRRVRADHTARFRHGSRTLGTVSSLLGVHILLINSHRCNGMTLYCSFLPISRSKPPINSGLTVYHRPASLACLVQMTSRGRPPGECGGVSGF